MKQLQDIVIQIWPGQYTLPDLQRPKWRQYAWIKSWCHMIFHQHSDRKWTKVLDQGLHGTVFTKKLTKRPINLIQISIWWLQQLTLLWTLTIFRRTSIRLRRVYSASCMDTQHLVSSHVVMLRYCKSPSQQESLSGKLKCSMDMRYDVSPRTTQQQPLQGIRIIKACMRWR